MREEQIALVKILGVAHKIMVSKEQEKHITSHCVNSALYIMLPYFFPLLSLCCSLERLAIRFTENL